MTGRWVESPSRREFLGASGVLLASLFTARAAQASLVRGLTLPELVKASTHVVVGTPLEAHSEWADVGGRKIVTDTRIRVEDTLALAAPGESELVVRVLGGIVGKLGERVDGQPALELGQPCTLFLTPVSPLLAWVTGAAQGHYPLLADAQKIMRLRASPHLPTLLTPERSAVAKLTGTTLAQARELLRAARP
jgi:hypothetical protein